MNKKCDIFKGSGGTLLLSNIKRRSVLGETVTGSKLCVNGIIEGYKYTITIEKLSASQESNEDNDYYGNE